MSLTLKGLPIRRSLFNRQLTKEMQKWDQQWNKTGGI